MKKTLISLFALAAISTSAFALGKDGADEGAYAINSLPASDSSALAVIKTYKKKLTAFEEMNFTADDNGRGDNDGGSNSDHRD